RLVLPDATIPARFRKVAMGAWGAGTFENDTACDLAAEIADSRGLAKMVSELDRALESGKSNFGPSPCTQHPGCPPSPICCTASAETLARGSCKLWLPAFLPEPHIWLQLFHHLRELRHVQRLRAVADRLLRSGMYFHNQSVGADGHSCLRQRRY